MTLTIDADFVDAGDFSQRNLKNGNWVQDSGTAGHLSVANADVIPGVLITFADASTATVVSKSGDGTGASSVVLSVAHASDSNLTSITGIIVSGANITLNSDSTALVSHSYAVTSHLNFPTSSSVRQVLPVGNYIGTQIRVTFKAGDDGGLTVANAAVGISNGGGDCTATPIELLFSAGHGFSLSAGATVTSDWATLLVDGSAGPVVIIDCTASVGHTAYLDSTGTIYHKTTTSYNTQNITEGDWTEYISYVSFVQTIEVRYGVPSNLYVAKTTVDHTQIISSGWADLNSVAVTQNGVGVKYAAICFDEATTWYAYVAGQRPVVQYSGDHWQYNDSGGSWQNATVDSELGALEQAMGIAQNQMTATQFATLSEANLDTLGYSPGITPIDLAIGLKVSGSDIPTLDKVTFTYTPGEGYALAGPGWCSRASSFGG